MLILACSPPGSGVAPLLIGPRSVQQDGRKRSRFFSKKNPFSDNHRMKSARGRPSAGHSPCTQAEPGYRVYLTMYYIMYTHYTIPYCTVYYSIYTHSCDFLRWGHERVQHCSRAVLDSLRYQSEFNTAPLLYIVSILIIIVLSVTITIIDK